MRKRYAKVGRFRVVVWNTPPRSWSEYVVVEMDFGSWHTAAGGNVDRSGRMWIADCFGVSLRDTEEFHEALKTAHRLAAEVVGSNGQL